MMTGAFGFQIIGPRWEDDEMQKFETMMKICIVAAGAWCATGQVAGARPVERLTLPSYTPPHHSDLTVQWHQPRVTRDEGRQRPGFTGAEKDRTGTYRGGVKREKGVRINRQGKPAVPAGQLSYSSTPDDGAPPD